MPATTAHPSQEQLSAYNLGQLPPDQALAIENHISECEPCCDTIVALSSDDTFVGLLKEARQLPIDQTVDQDGGSAGRASTSSGFPAPLAEHPRYEILGLIGKGGMGDVYKAKHRMMDRTVALKIINRELIRKTEAVDRFHREVKAAAKLSHPNIVTAYDAERAGDFHFMVMEYVDGVDLSQTVKDRGALPVAEACDFIRQAAVGLQHAHECGMVHRDIKPHNLMVTADGTVKILDFGLASLAPKAVTEAEMVEALGDLTAAGAIMGTPDFISPEQAEDAHQADIRSDIYSLGATLYYLLAGRVPFDDGSVMHKLQSHAQVEPESLKSLRNDIPVELENIVSRMMAKDPNERFQAPAEVAEALESFTKETQPSASTVPNPQTQPERRKLGFLPITAIAALLLGIVSAATVFYMQTDHGTVRVEVLDPSLTVSFNDQTIRLEDGDKEFTIDAGQQKRLVVTQSDTDYQFETESFQIRRGEKIAFKVDMLPGEIVVTKDDKSFAKASVLVGEWLAVGPGDDKFRLTFNPDGTFGMVYFESADLIEFSATGTYAADFSINPAQLDLNATIHNTPSAAIVSKSDTPPQDEEDAAAAVGPGHGEFGDTDLAAPAPASEESRTRTEKHKFELIIEVVDANTIRMSDLEADTRPKTFGGRTMVLRRQGVNSLSDVEKAKISAYKAASVANLRQIAQAFMFFEMEHGYFPSVTTKLPGAKHPVSWRVAILKYLDEDLYNQYKLNEPWYSDHNKRLMAKIPSFFRHPSQKRGATYTSYVTLTGENTATGNGETPITASDGARTILVTEATTNIPWTKPEDHLVGDESLLPTRRPHQDGWNVVFVDGSAHVISADTPADELKTLIMRDSVTTATGTRGAPAGYKEVRFELNKPVGEVQTAIREYYVDKYPLFAASVNQRSKVWSDPERLLRAETRRQIGQLSINSPVSEVIHSFPGKPLVTFSESSLLSQTELLVTNVNLYQTGNDTCRIVVTRQRRRANANQNHARGKPITENEIRKLVMSEDSGDHSQETNGSKETSDGAATADASIDSAVRDDVPAGVSSEGVNVRDSGAQTSDRSRAPVEEKTTGFLIEAAKRGDLEAVKAALEAGVAPNLPSNPLTNLFTTEQLTALHWAVAQRISEGKTIEPSPEIAKRLIEAGADVNAADYLGQTPLEWAARHASPEVVEMLIKAGANVNAESRYGTVLMAGTRVEIAKLLIEAGADVNAGKHTSALANAAKYGNAELIRLLVGKGAKVNDPKDPPIHWAGKPEAAEALIEAGADVNLRNAKGETALHLNKSTWSPNAETVELLIDAGADVKAQNATGSTPLHAAVQQGKPEIATLLIAAGADVDARDKQGNTPLSIAQWALSSARGVNGVENTPYETSVQLLVDSGAKDDGRTELQQAVAAGDLEQVKKLIAAQADVNETGPQRITAMHLASEQGHVAILAALIEAGAKVDAVDAQRMQPLHLAANAETARLLIAKGANVNTGSPSPLYMATMNGNADVVRELLRNDANATESDCATMLNWATFAGQIEVVKELFELRDAKTLLAVESTYSPLHVAASGSFGDMGSSAGAQQRLDIAELLVANGADVNAPWGENVNPLSGAAHMIGTTPLMFASQRGEAEMVKFLLDQQADPKATNASGQAALHFAAQCGHRDVVELLLKAKADVNALTREAQTPLDLTDDAAVKILLIQKDGKTAGELLKDSQR